MKKSQPCKEKRGGHCKSKALAGKLVFQEQKAGRKLGQEL